MEAPLKLDQLRTAVRSGEIDTVLLAFTDMQGRLQGKRLTATHFLDEVAEHGAEACNYLLAVDVEMNTVGGYAMASWERGYGDFEMKPDFDTLRLVPWHAGHRDDAWPTSQWAERRARSSRRRGRSCAASSTGSPSAGWEAVARHRARVHPLPRRPTSEAATRATATSSRPTSTTSTTRSSAPRGSSR